MKFNTAGAKEDAAKNLHPEGTYLGTIIGAEVKKTKTDKDMIVLQWKTSEGKLRSYVTYVDEYPGLFLRPMHALGLDDGYFDTEPELEEVAMECLKRQALLDISHGEYQGNPVANIEDVKAVPENGIKP